MRAPAAARSPNSSRQRLRFSSALDGKLSLDDDIRKYIPELPDYAPTVTIQHLINHTSGLRD